MLSFDEIRVVDGKEKGSIYSPEEFARLKLSERVKMIIGKEISFYKHGEEVDKVQSLNEMRKRRV